MLERPTLPPLARKFLSRLRSEGIDPSDEEVVWLYELGKQATQAPNRSAQAAGLATHIHGVDVYPYTPGAVIWANEVALPIIDGDFPYDVLCMAFAAAHSYERKTLCALTEVGQIKLAIKIWSNQITAPMNTFISDFLETFAQDPLSLNVTSDDVGRWDATLTHLEGAPSKWFWEESIDAITAKIEALEKQHSDSGGAPNSDRAKRTLACILKAEGMILNDRRT